MRNIIVREENTVWLCDCEWAGFIRSTLNMSVRWNTTEPLGCGDSLYLSFPVFILMGIDFCIGRVGGFY
ncbi:hypothetical protein F5J12DRAFT_772125 [Pisolithus orientalis]|uniref:uncharacterized protein n=1 Tax=Pisolithus orientalis TaxID=936130 RepID=UPI002225171E|nr:uncharacterized protein F5J12DRAFT_772125 [Pisolithus orientalis]KAI5998412.1 hypothetical protein F5J12DRAFT_772125 [Pisolithus orientalis]